MMWNMNKTIDPAVYNFFKYNNGPMFKLFPQISKDIHPY